MAYVAITVRGGSDEAQSRARRALTSYFEDSWGEVLVELTHEGTRWRIDTAWTRPPAGHQPQPGESWDCTERVANALVLAGAPVHQSRRAFY